MDAPKPGRVVRPNYLVRRQAEAPIDLRIRARLKSD
jgi:hypothetical protein